MYAEQSEGDEEESDTGTPAAGSSQVPKVLPAGRITFASCVDDICRHYEGSHTRGPALHASSGSPRSNPLALLASSPEENLRVYKLDVVTGMILHTLLLSI